ncbi:MAG TPA: hypothetical protein EYO73_07060 [Sulfurimonas sp.]|nr:hypothetical protein [Sulfurimonas sp.]
MIKIVTPLLLLSSLAYCQDMKNLEDMMQDMQKMQICMAKVDFHSLEGLQEHAFNIQKEVEQMCQQGQRDKAQSKAISFSKEIMNFPAVLQLKQCSKGTAMESIMQMSKHDFENHHVCEAEKVKFSLPSNQRVQW